MEQQEEVRVAWGTGIAGHVAESGEPVNIPDAYQVDHSIDFIYEWNFKLGQEQNLKRLSHRFYKINTLHSIY